MAILKVYDGTKFVEILAGAVDASIVGYSPSDLTDWSSSADPGDTDDALDQLADRLKTVEALPGNLSRSPLMVPPLHPEASGDITAVTDVVIDFIHLGSAPKDASQIDVLVNVATAYVAGNHAEVGIFTSTGDFPLFTTASLSRLGFTDVASTYNSTGRKKTRITASISAGDDLWFAYVSSALLTTNFELSASVRDTLRSGAFQFVSGKISTVAVPVATSLAGASRIPALVRAAV